jgi:hypothetical protein
LTVEVPRASRTRDDDTVNLARIVSLARDRPGFRAHIRYIGSLGEQLTIDQRRKLSSLERLHDRFPFRVFGIACDESRIDAGVIERCRHLFNMREINTEDEGGLSIT